MAICPATIARISAGVPVWTSSPILKWPKFGDLVQDVEPSLYDVVQIEAA